MKTTITLALTALVAQADVTIFVETPNECWFNEGGTWIKPCFDLFYWYCDKYEIEADSSCKVRTFSDTRIDNPWDEITVHYTSYGYEGQWLAEIEIEDEDSTDSSSSGGSSGGSSFDTFKRMFSWGIENTTNLINVPNPRPDTHDWYPEWVDPFADECYELTAAAVEYDSETMPKLDLIDRMCGFMI